MEGKKISFGFMKTKKADKPVIEEKKQFIECMEESSIKVVGGEQVTEAAPLVIPMKPNTLITAERLQQIADEVESAINEPEPSEEKTDEPIKQEPVEGETLDQMVVRELLNESKKDVKVENDTLTVPIQSKPVVEGQKESTLEDYEDVPIQEFGMAMLRGMGWKPSKDQTKYKQPQLRPKGLGLGADKVVKDNQKKKSVNEKGEELSIMKNAFVKITSGKYSGYYGKVVSLDEDNGRVMVDITVKKETVSLSEFMMQAVTKSEFDKESKVINADSFDEYKRNEKSSQKTSKYDSPKSHGKERELSSNTKSQDSNKSDLRAEKSKDGQSRRAYVDTSEGRSRDRHRRDSSSSEERSRKKKKKKRYSSSDSLSSVSDLDRKRKHKSSRRRYSSSDSDSDSPKRDKRKKSPEKKRDIDKKRKGKKKKRDRDRSPNYKKYRK